MEKLDQDKIQNSEQDIWSIILDGTRQKPLKFGASDQRHQELTYYAIVLKVFSILMKLKTQWKLLSNGRVKKEFYAEKTGEMSKLQLWMLHYILTPFTEEADKLSQQLEDATTLASSQPNPDSKSLSF